MTTHSPDGREWARADDAEPGAILEADGRFQCCPAGARFEVHEIDYFCRYIRCHAGQHNLSCILSADEQHYEGFWLVEVAK